MMDVTMFIHGDGNAWPEGCTDPFCRACNGPDVPVDGRGNTSLSLALGDLRAPRLVITVDAGQGMWRGLLRAHLPTPDVLALTHGHPDHLNAMELDTLAHAAGDRRVCAVASRETWDRVPAYLRGRFDFFEITAGRTLVLQVRGEEVEIVALDASDHFPGGLIYRISTGGFRFGALFDLRRWAPQHLASGLLEGLDLAVLEGNSLWPLSERTGHVSVAEDLAFLGALGCPPRLSLITHVGHEEPRLSRGDLVALLHGLAPHLAVTMAYKGMSVSCHALPPRNPVAVLDAVTNLVIGVAEKRDAHARGLLHGSVILLARPEPGKLLVYVRHEHQSFPGCFDTFGGHGQPSDAADPRATALREAREELRIFDAGGLQVMLMEDWLVPLGDRHELESGDHHNRERSTAFGLALPPGVTARAFDETDDGREVELRVEAMTIDQVQRLRRESPTRIADGLSRLLDHMDGDRDFTAQLQSFVQGESQ